MERTMSVEERIRRAEERYNKKIGQDTTLNEGFNVEAKKNRQETNGIDELKLIRKKNRKKMMMQIFLCLVIYIAFYTVNNRQYIFSEGFQNDVNSFFTEKMNMGEMYDSAKSYFEANILKKGNQQKEGAEADEEQLNKETTEGQNNDLSGEAASGEENSEATEDSNEKDSETSDSKDTSSENVGGAEDTESEKSSKDDTSSQMEKDAKKIKSEISFIKPIEGRISSTFGWRNPTVSTVPKYHTGLDIAAVAGTKIKSATDGEIILASSEGDYGKHYQVKSGDIIIIYAHCQKLYLKEGDKVVQGQEIAEVGSTGNSTGPHLHFEIRIEDRKVDPQLILDI